VTTRRTVRAVAGIAAVRPVVLLLAATAAAACGRGFVLSRYPTPESLYAASLARFRAGKTADAILGFERVTLELPARDSLLPRAHWWLGEAHRRQKEWLLAAQSFERLYEGFPDDSLADDAMLATADAYAALWRRPDLTPEQGRQALDLYRLMQSVYPESPLRERALAGERKLFDWLAQKDLLVAQHYLRRRAYDSAILYLREVVENYPGAPSVRTALLLLHETYLRPELRWVEDANEICATLRQNYPDDREVRARCPAPAPAP
jgi:outer membrane assembly lipoprotein YfiO